MGYVNGVNLLPATGEFTYDSVAYQGARLVGDSLQPLVPINTYSGPPAGFTTDMQVSISQLVAAFPAVQTVAIVVAWFFNSETAGSTNVYPSTTYVGGQFETAGGSPDHWRCSGLTEASTAYAGGPSIIIPISQTGGSFTYGGTPSDQSIVRCIEYVKSQGLRVVFYPFLLGDIPGSNPWRGRISFSPDVSSLATSAVDSFLGSAATSQFSRDTTNLTVGYSGSPTDWTFRRMILHYANLCVIAGGVDLFLLGSELRGLETIRGPAWTVAGTVAGGLTTWDYPFVNGLIALSNDVRSVFDGAGLTKNASSLKNLVSYAADWSSWMGWAHVGANPALPVADGLWPHLDQLWSSPNIDIVCFDNYLPISDWTTATGVPLAGGVLATGAPGGQDAYYWSDPAPTSWPPTNPNSIGLGLSGVPSLYSIPYLQANIEGGEKFNWFYANDPQPPVITLDPFGSDLTITRSGGDRVIQNRTQYYPGQQILGNKQLRWWWNNQHYALYDDGDGTGETPKGAPTPWVANSKSITFTEYGFPSNDKSTNQPNVFFTGNSSESATAYWSIWDPAVGGGYLPRRDQSLQLLALQAVYDYWFGSTPSNNVTISDVVMVQDAFCSVWNWDARPFPTFPLLTSVWGDTGNWEAGNWLSGKGPFIARPIAEAPPPPGTYAAFPVLAGQGWSVHYEPMFTTSVASHVSGRASRFARTSIPTYDIEIAFDLLRMAPPYLELQAVIGFIAQHHGQETPFTFPVPADLQATIGLGATLTCRFADDQEDLDEFMASLWQLQSLKLRTVKGE